MVWAGVEVADLLAAEMERIARLAGDKIQGLILAMALVAAEGYWLEDFGEGMVVEIQSTSQRASRSTHTVNLPVQRSTLASHKVHIPLPRRTLGSFLPTPRMLGSQIHIQYPSTHS